MIVNLKNIGMLDEANFEVSNVTIICGHNNTGKTYATYSLYGYIDYMRNIRPNLFRFLNSDINSKIKEEALSFKLTFEQLHENILNHIKNKANEYTKRSLHLAMAGREDDFQNSIFNVSLKISIEKVKEAVKKYLNDFTNNEKNKFDYTLYDNGLEISGVDFKSYQTHFYDTLVHIIFPRAFILSVERTGASIFQDELDFIKRSVTDVIFDLFNKDIGVDNVLKALNRAEQSYALPVRDNVEFIRNLKEVVKKQSIFKKEKDKYKYILDAMNQILGGKYKVTDHSTLFQPKGSKQSYNVEIASSSVRSLLMLNYYLLHEAQIGDLLIIDEPELNLHPQNQILLARLLALLSNVGIKIFITTHSDYIIRELSNCIILNNFNEKQITDYFKKKDYTIHHKLKDSNVKAYIAKTTPKKINTLEAANVTPDNGIAMESFNDVIEYTFDIDNIFTKIIIDGSYEKKDK